MLRIAFLVIVASSALVGCGDSKPPDPRAAGKRLFASQGCMACHMTRGEGSMMGPPLRGLAANWTREKLASYMADPEGYSSNDERLKSIKARFKTPMAPVKAPEADRLALADYVLTFP
jgi:mono/diheme cytochrome c family protein